MAQENKMGVMPEGKLLISMSLPMMISMLVQSMYNIVDSYFVSKISEEALAAVSEAFPVQLFMIAIGAGTGVGVNALVSRALGEHDKEKASRFAQNGIFVYAISYVVVVIFGLLINRPFFELLTTDGQEQMVEYGVSYLSICIIFSFGMYAQFIFERLLQSTGRTLFTMFSQASGAIINIIFDYLLIFGIGPFPEMGIRGAAVATVMGQIAAGIIALIGNITINKDISLNFKGFRPSGKAISNIYKIGVPSILMQSVGSIMMSGMNYILKEFSATAVAFFGIYFKLQSFFIMPVLGLNNGLIPILSYNMGARNSKRMRKTLKYGYIIACCSMVFGFLCFELIPKQLLSIFSSNPDMFDIGISGLRIIGFSYLVAWVSIVNMSLFQAVGKAVYSMWIAIARQLLVLLPLAYILAKIGGLDLIWYSFLGAELISVTISTIFKKKTYATVLKDL